MTITAPIDWAIDQGNPHLRHSIRQMASLDAFHSDPEETAESYVMDRMTPEQAGYYESHLGECASCTRALEEAEAFVRAIAAAGRGMRAKVRPKVKGAC